MTKRHQQSVFFRITYRNMLCCLDPSHFLDRLRPPRASVRSSAVQVPISLPLDLMKSSFITSFLSASLYSVSLSSKSFIPLGRGPDSSHLLTSRPYFNLTGIPRPSFNTLTTRFFNRNRLHLPEKFRRSLTRPVSAPYDSAKYELLDSISQRCKKIRH